MKIEFTDKIYVCNNCLHCMDNKYFISDVHPAKVTIDGEELELNLCDKCVEEFKSLISNFNNYHSGL